MKKSKASYFMKMNIWIYFSVCSIIFHHFQSLRFCSTKYLQSIFQRNWNIFDNKIRYIIPIMYKSINIIYILDIKWFNNIEIDKSESFEWIVEKDDLLLWLDEWIDFIERILCLRLKLNTEWLKSRILR